MADHPHAQDLDLVMKIRLLATDAISTRDVSVVRTSRSPLPAPCETRPFHTRPRTAQRSCRPSNAQPRAKVICHAYISSYCSSLREDSSIMRLERHIRCHCGWMNRRLTPPYLHAEPQRDSRRSRVRRDKVHALL